MSPMCTGTRSWLSLWESCRRRRLRGFWQSRYTPSGLASLRHLSQRERQGRPHAWLSLWESCRRRRLRGSWQSRYTLSVLASLSHLSQRERQEGMRRKEIPDVYLSNFAGKIQEDRSGFLGRFKRGRGEIRNPPDPKPQTSAAFAVWKGRNEHRG